MLQIRQILAQVFREYGPAVLPVSAATAFALIAAYQALEPMGASSTTAGGAIYAWLSRYVLSWLGKGDPDRRRDGRHGIRGLLDSLAPQGLLPMLPRLQGSHLWRS